LSNKEWVLVGLLALVQFTNIVDAMIVMPMGNIFMELFEINASQLSLLVASYAFGAFASSIAGSVYLDRFDRKRSLLFLYTGFSLGTLLCAFAPGYWSLLWIRFVTGLFGGMLGALVLSIVSDAFSFSRRGKAIGIVTAAFSAASALGVPTGLFLADRLGWQAPFLFLGITGFAILTLIALYLPSLDKHLEGSVRRNLWATFGYILKDANQSRALLLGLVIVLGHFMIIPFITPYMIRNVGFTQGEITFIYLLGGGVTLFSSPLVGKLTDRYGAIKVLKIAMPLSFVPVLLLTHLGAVSVSVGLLVTTLFFILGTGRMIPPNTLITAAVGPQGRGSFMSLKSALQQLAIGSSSLISGSIVRVGEQGQFVNYPWVGFLSIAICLMALWIAPKLKIASGN
jgi:MFS transporter, DHA1 family, inner membrane transport protein